MKEIRLLWTILLVVAVSMVSRAGDNVLSAVDATVIPGQGTSIGILLNNSDVVNGLQFDIVLPEGFKLVNDEKGSPIFSGTERANGFSIVCKEVVPGKYRVMALSFSGARVKGNEGMVLSFSIDCDPSMKKGVHIIRFEEIHLSLVEKPVSEPDLGYPSFEAKVTVE